MYEEFLKAKKFLSLLRNSKGQKIDNIQVRYYDDVIRFSGVWQGHRRLRIRNENKLILKNKDREGRIYYFSDALKEISYLGKEFYKVHASFSFNEKIPESYTQDYSDEKSFKKGICFSQKVIGNLSSFYPKNNYGVLKFSHSYHEHMHGNSILLSQEEHPFAQRFKKRLFFKIDYLNNNYVHIFEEDPYGNKQSFIRYYAAFKMPHSFPLEEKTQKEN